MRNEDDYCDLDPTKLCDNCCKCLEAKDAYRTVRADMHIGDAPPIAEPVAEMAEEDELPESYLEEVLLPFDEDEEEGEDEFEFGKNLEPLDIDPALLAEWEAKLADIGQSEQSIPQIRGIRRKRER